MTGSLTSRTELLPYVGAAVSVSGTLIRTGVKPFSHYNSSLQHTLLIGDLKVEPDLEIDHAWLRLGPTGTKRVSKLQNKYFLGNAPVRFDAKVAVYETEEQARLGLQAPHNLEIYLKGRWRCIVRGIERYDGDGFDDSVLEEYQQQWEREAQAQVLTRLREVNPKDKASQQILSTFFVRGQLCSIKQIQHAQRILEAM